MKREMKNETNFSNKRGNLRFARQNLLLLEKRNRTLMGTLRGVVMQPLMERGADGEKGGNKNPDNEQTGENRFAPARTHYLSLLHAAGNKTDVFR